MSSLSAFSSGSRASASDLLRSSSSGVIGVPLKILGGLGAMSVGLRRRMVNVMAKIVKKGKAYAVEVCRPEHQSIVLSLALSIQY
ncbi:uncharacterized protein A4U43_C02F13550 [Asparagus officinalis]|uniref:Uncharacterized protein n=1 Tax=Asparagus officinalis TaxID=4686 RepID=A0A5P1FI79_ASPOF|nr:uncharacterized protein A4U43_C02F13550 [Asparagus officinalis]